MTVSRVGRLYDKVRAVLIFDENACRGLEKHFDGLEVNDLVDFDERKRIGFFSDENLFLCRAGDNEQFLAPFENEDASGAIHRR